MQIMYFLALATDYDGTIAHHGTVEPPTLQALERFRESGRRLVLVTGRELPDLKGVFPQTKLFDLIVAENGALLYEPATETEHCIAPPPPAAFVERLRRRGVTPLSTGRAIVATWEPHEKTVIEVIRDMGLEMQIIFNKGAVMVLPAGINKAVGLRAGLKRLDLVEPNVVAVGDAENDHAFLLSCGCSAAVANALQSVKDECDIVLDRPHGEGVADLVDMILRRDRRIVRHVRMAADGELPKESSFYFRGPGNKLNLRAQNLMLFAQIAEGVDAATWEHHRRAHDYSSWFRRVIKDEELTAEAAAAEKDAALDSAESRRRIIAAIHRRYITPAGASR